LGQSERVHLLGTSALRALHQLPMGQIDIEAKPPTIVHEGDGRILLIAADHLCV
jgi:hypothetical protein